MTDRVVLLVTTHRVAPGLLSWPAWETLRDGDVLTGAPEHSQLPALAAAGIPVEVLEDDPASVAQQLRERASAGRLVVWLTAPAGDEDVARALGDLATRDPELEVELLHASYDVPGARLLDVVATMDRLRSPGGCPWDAQQTHASLAPYLLEEAYEAYQTIEDDDLSALREELGDVLLQVAFHARLAEELPEDERWSIDDVAGGLVDKLVRRHPHVFGDREVAGADEVVVNWDVIKAEEKGRASAVEGVPLAQAALSLAATLQRKATKLGMPADLVAGEPGAGETPAAAVAAAATTAEEDPGVEAVSAVLWAAVALARSLDVDPEAALRGRARRFRNAVAALERTAHEEGTDVRALDDVGWRERWSRAEREES